jgi:hypothetical protein
MAPWLKCLERLSAGRLAPDCASTLIVSQPATLERARKYQAGDEACWDPDRSKAAPAQRHRKTRLVTCDLAGRAIPTKMPAGRCS